MTAAKHSRVLGDTLLPLNRILRLSPNRDPIDLSLYTVKFYVEADDGTVTLAETATGVTVHPTQAFTANATTDLLTCNGHGVRQDDQIIVATSSALPGGLAASTRYFAVQVTNNSFSLANTPGGAAIDITSAGTGTHTFYIVGSFQYTFPSNTPSSAGNYRGWAVLVDGSGNKARIPDDEYGIPIEVKPLGN